MYHATWMKYGIMGFCYIHQLLNWMFDLIEKHLKKEEYHHTIIQTSMPQCWFDTIFGCITPDVCPLIVSIMSPPIIIKVSAILNLAACCIHW